MRKCAGTMKLRCHFIFKKTYLISHFKWVDRRIQKSVNVFKYFIFYKHIEGEMSVNASPKF